MTVGQPEKAEKWGRGRWILNKKLLFDAETQNEIRERWENWREYKRDFKSILDWWDKGKRILADIYKYHGARKQRDQRRERESLERELSILLNRTNVTGDET